MARLPRSLDEWVPWVIRALWVLLPLTVGPTLGVALDGASRPVQVVASLGLWAGWAAGVVGTFIPHAVSLTAVRVLAPAVLAVTVAAALGGHPSALAGGWAAITAAWVFAPAWGFRCVNGSAYPNERRFLLRVPGAMLFGPLGIAWALAVSGAAAGPLLLAARQWVWGGVTLVAGVPLAVVLVRALHNLSRRWAVFVPAGLVLHDPITMTEPVLFKRASITRLGPALVAGATEAVDLSQRAPGLVLEAELAAAVPLNLIQPGRRESRGVEAQRLLFTPTRPGALLDEARSRRFAVG